MAKYRKKPVVIDAIQWTGENIREIDAFSGAKWKVNNPKIYVPTLEGEMTADKGDYIIRGVKGEYYPCKSDIFEQTYEKVDDGAA